MELIPAKWRSFWNKWELRVLVLISLFIQIILILFGSHRKRTYAKRINILLWLGYLLADWAATLALGVLAKSQDDSIGNIGSKDHHANLNSELLSFWAPFLLLHLGGPDTITAFSLEDNELWLRHLLELIFQVGAACYVFIRSLPGNKLWHATIQIFAAGIIKYGERTWALMSASRENFRESMVSASNSNHKNAKFIDECIWKKNAGLNAEIVWEEPEFQMPPNAAPQEISHLETISKAHYFFEIFKRLIVDLVLTFHDRYESQSFFLERKWEEAYQVIEIELGFVYDVLYTKIGVVLHTLKGCILRLLTVSCLFSAFIFFLHVEKRQYFRMDVIISYILLSCAIALEIWSLTRLFFSDWTLIWMKKHKLNRLLNHSFAVISYFRPRKRWSNAMAQYNLINFCLKDKSSVIKKIIKVEYLKELYIKYRYRTYEKVTDDLKKFIFEDLQEKLKTVKSLEDYKRLNTCRGELALEMIDPDNLLKWSVEVEFDESILLWHIATDICYHNKDDEITDDSQERNIAMSTAMSNYLIYLLVSRPFMLPDGIGQIRFDNTCAEFKDVFSREKLSNAFDACSKLLEKDIIIPRKEMIERKSVLFDAAKLANSLLELDGEKRWDLISKMWVEMLCFSASHCRGYHHAQGLSVGGELLTIVWLLMAHLGFGDKYRGEGLVPAKLIVEM